MKPPDIEGTAREVESGERPAVPRGPLWNGENATSAVTADLGDAGTHDRPANPLVERENATSADRRSDVPIGFTVTADLDTNHDIERSKETRPPIQTSEAVSALLEITGCSALELRESTLAEPDWFIPGFVARGWTAMLSAREKEGKGTLILYLLGKLERGEPSVFGDAHPEPVTALVYTEEPVDSEREKLAQFGLEQATIVHHWELAALTTWEQKVEYLTARALADGHELIYLDNVSRATSTQEEAGTELARRVELLSDAAKKYGLAVILDHHQRKSGGKIEDLARGGTALQGAVEAYVVMQRPGDWESRERRLFARGRLSAAVWHKTIRLSEDAHEYELPNPDELDFKTRVLLERTEWTAKDFAEAAGVAEKTARDWLNNCPRLHVPEPDKKPKLYLVQDSEEPAL